MPVEPAPPYPARPILGRDWEQQELKEALESGRPELICLMGRRRIGKTFLIRQFFRTQCVFELTGTANTKASVQLNNFAQVLHQRSGEPLKVPATWNAAFWMLQEYLEPLLKENIRRAVFLDELPWLGSAKSGFLQAFEYFWNNWGSNQPNLIAVVCGSASSWMTTKIIRSRGGMHNRVTRYLTMKAFSLKETEQFLRNRGLMLDRSQILELYLTLGGIPYYLDLLKPGDSAAQNIDLILFSPTAALKYEFDNLYAALFEKHDRHISVIRALSTKSYGLTRAEVSALSKILDGGNLGNVLKDLEDSGFIQKLIPFGKSTRNAVYRLSDPFTLFHFHWLENKTQGLDPSGWWVSRRLTPEWSSWSGYAFENLALLHIPQIKKALGISGIRSDASAWYHRSKGPQDPGCQIDLLLDRADGIISLLELKFSREVFSINKAYAENLDQKVRVFKRQTKTRKTVFLTLLTSNGVQRNEHYLGRVVADLAAEQLFE